MRIILTAGMVFVLAGLSLPAAAQTHGPPSGGAAIVGTVRQTVGGVPAERLLVCAVLPDTRGTSWHHCATVEASDAFRLDRLPAGTWEIDVICETLAFFVKPLVSEHVTVSEAAPVERTWEVDPAGCDPRPVRRVEGVFRGYYTPGFESSEFIPCAADGWFLPSDSLRTGPYDERHAWAVLSQATRLPEGFTWPDAPRDAYRNPRYYVRWQGTVVGPGRYGHMGVTAFELRVDSVLELRAPREDDCEPVQELRRIVELDDDS